jgi:Tfp pilus assembly protein PilF
MLEPPGKLRFLTERLEAITERLEADTTERLEADTIERLEPETIDRLQSAKSEPSDSDNTGRLESESIETPTVVPAPRPPWNPRWLRWAMLGALCFVTLLGIGLYAHTLNFPFQFDDHIYLVGSPFVTDMKDLIIARSFHDVANQSALLGLGYDPSVNFILRPVAYLTFHLNYLANGFDPAGFRAVNIGIHCANAILLFLLLTHLLRKSPKAEGLPAGSVLFIPFAAAILFVAHPLHTESVTYIVQRFNSMVGFFLLSSLLLHFLSLSAKGRVARLALRSCAVIATIAGMLTKESMFTAPLLIVMLHVVVMGGTWKRATWQALPHLVCMLIIPVLALLTSHAQSGSGNVAAAMQIAASSKDPAYQAHYFLTQLGVMLEYVRLIVWPQGMNVDRQYQLATSILQLRVWLSGLVIIGIILAAWRHYRSHKGDIRHVLISAGVFWFFLRLVVSSSFVPLDDLMVDHRTYGASMGLLTVLACALDMIRTRWPLAIGIRLAAPVALAAWVALLSVATMNRNQVWQSETSLWSDAVLKSPNKARPWDNLGVCHYMAGRQDEAVTCLVKSVTINPQHLPAYMKLGVIYNAQQKFAEAADWSRKGLDIFPDSAPLHYNLGVALCGMGKIQEGLIAMQHAVQYMPTHAAAHAALGQIFRHLGDPAQSLVHYRRAAALGADDTVVVTAVAELEALTASR